MNAVLVYNWKTYISSADDATALVNALEESSSVEVIVCPSSLHILSVASAMKKKTTSLGAQDISMLADKPQTGNLSGVQLVASGVSHVIVGHAETRASGVTNMMVAAKMLHALSAGLVAVVCLSEQGDDAESNGEEVVRQLEDIFRVSEGGAVFDSRIIIAYEPTAHIGAKDALAPEKIKRVVDLLRDTLSRYHLAETPVLYGGSVNAENAEGILESAGADGFLLGRASVHADTANVILRSL